MLRCRCVSSEGLGGKVSGRGWGARVDARGFRRGPRRKGLGAKALRHPGSIFCHIPGEVRGAGVCCRARGWDLQGNLYVKLLEAFKNERICRLASRSTLLEDLGLRNQELLCLPHLCQRRTVPAREGTQQRRQVAHSADWRHTEASSAATLVPGDHTGSRLQISSTAFAACLVAAGRVEEEEEEEEAAAAAAAAAEEERAGEGEEEGEGRGRGRRDHAV